MTLSGLVEFASVRYPTRAALVDVDRSWTWAELADVVGRTRAALVDAGVSPGERVGVHCHKSASGFIAMHAVVGVGAVAVPLDPSAPAERLARICSTMGISAILTHAPRRAGVEAVAALHQVAVVLGLDGPVAGVGQVVGDDRIAAAQPRPPAEVELDAWAYIITTSGSTGEPKGIVHTHRSALAYAEAAVETFDVGSTDRVADIAPHHFDQSTFALWAAPMAGAAVVVMPEPHQRLPASLSARVQDEGVTIWYSVPFLLQQFVTRGDLDRRDLSALRLVQFGGEVPIGAVLGRLAAMAPQARFANIYGPAELNQCTHHFATASDLRSGVVPIGRPWPASQISVVDPEHDSPDGPQVDKGELWVASATMMAGYFDEPILDTRAIVEIDGRRWYRTGDLVEWSGDVLVFLGRLDHQVKVRGHRVELEAVEAELERVDGVESAVVAVQRAADGADRLVAAVVGSEATVPDVVDHARAALPSWSVPSPIVAVRGYETTGSGKLDRRSARLRLLESLEES